MPVSGLRYWSFWGARNTCTGTSSCGRGQARAKGPAVSAREEAAPVPVSSGASSGSRAAHPSRIASTPFYRVRDVSCLQTHLASWCLRARPPTPMQSKPPQPPPPHLLHHGLDPLLDVVCCLEVNGRLDLALVAAGVEGMGQEAKAVVEGMCWEPRAAQSAGWGRVADLRGWCVGRQHRHLQTESQTQSSRWP
jgi:hypothetical protein